MRISVELVGWNKKAEIFDFNVYAANTDDVLASFDVKNGKVFSKSVIEDEGLDYEDWPETANEATSAACGKKYFELVEKYFWSQFIQKANSFDNSEA